MPEHTWNYEVWTPWAQPAVPLYLVLTLNPSFGPLRKHIGLPLFTSVIVFEKRTGTWVFRSSEAAALGQRMIDLLSVPANRSAFEDHLSRTVSELEAAIESVRSNTLEGMPISELLALFTSVEDSFTSFYEIGAFVEPVQIAAQGSLNAYLDSNGDALSEAMGMPRENLSSAAYALESETFGVAIAESLKQCAKALVAAESNDAAMPGRLKDQEGSREILPGALTEILRSSEALTAEVSRHAAAYSWSRNNYERCMTLTPEDVLAELLALGKPRDALASLEQQSSVVTRSTADLRAAKRRLLAALPAYEANLMSMHDLIGGTLLDLRKRLVMQSNGVIAEILIALAPAVDASLEDLLFLLPQELAGFANAPGRYGDRIKRRKEKMVVYQGDFGVLDELAFGPADFTPMDGPYIAEGGTQSDDALDRLSDRLKLFEQESGTTSALRGVPISFDADHPVLRGTVRVVRDPINDEFEDGDILVASSTTPDFMSILLRCSAIITDWGGQTSHAAITARELGKPCLIGTNYASSILRSGDEIEVDFRSGIVHVESD